MYRDYLGQDVGSDGIERKKDDNKNTQVPDLGSWAGCCKTIHCYRDVMTVQVWQVVGKPFIATGM